MSRFVTWQPTAGSAWTDAMSKSWMKERPYIFPPPRMIMKILHKIKVEKVTALIICPDWPAQAYYSLLKRQLVQPPEALPQGPNLTICSITGAQHPIWKHLKLTAFLVQGKGLHCPRISTT